MPSNSKALSRSPQLTVGGSRADLRSAYAIYGTEPTKNPVKSISALSRHGPKVTTQPSLKKTLGKGISLKDAAKATLPAPLTNGVASTISKQTNAQNTLSKLMNTKVNINLTKSGRFSAGSSSLIGNKVKQLNVPTAHSTIAGHRSP